MSFFARLFGFSGQRREAPGAAPSAPPPVPAVAPTPPPPVVEPTPIPADATEEAAPKRPPFPSDAQVEAALRMLECRADRAAAWAPVLAEVCRRFEINTPGRVAAFLANGVHETGHLSRLVESLNYSVDGLLATFGRHRITEAQARALGRKPDEKALPAARQKALAKILYGGEWGWKTPGNLIGGEDAWRFRGHGFFQLTGRHNYVRFARVVGNKPEALPALLCTREGAAESAAQFFVESGCLVEADAGDIAAVRRIINGGELGLKEVEVLYANALAALAARGP